MKKIVILSLEIKFSEKEIVALWIKTLIYLQIT